MDNPRIINGICEFCGISADACVHYGAPEVAEKKEVNNITHNVYDYSLLNIKIADIIIPHHNRHDMLNRLLGFIDLSIFNVIVVAGGSFGHNCNRGASLAETNNLIFCNDDIVISNEQLIKFAVALGRYDFVGSTQIAGEKKKKYWGIGLFKVDGKIKHSIAFNKEDTLFPSGFLFGIRKSFWKKIEGFDERFKTGNEDVDFGLKAITLDAKIKMLDLEIEHNESQSSGRFKFCNENEKMFYDIWGDKLKNIYEKTR